MAGDLPGDPIGLPIDAVIGVPVVALPQAIYQGARTTSTQIRPPVDAQGVYFQIDRGVIPNVPGIVAWFFARLSLDGGVTFSPDPDGRAAWPWGIFPAGGALSGAPRVQDDLPQSVDFFNLPLPAGQNRVVVVEITPLQPVQLSLSVTCTKPNAVPVPPVVL